MWVSFRSQLRGSSGLVPLSLTVSRYFKKFGQPPAKKAFSGQQSAFSKKKYSIRR
jgi:hypothetical protein